MAPKNLGTKLTALVVDDNILNRKIHQAVGECWREKSRSGKWPRSSGHSLPWANI